MKYSLGSPAQSRTRADCDHVAERDSGGGGVGSGGGAARRLGGFEQVKLNQWQEKPELLLDASGRETFRLDQGGMEDDADAASAQKYTAGKNSGSRVLHRATFKAQLSSQTAPSSVSTAIRLSCLERPLHFCENCPFQEKSLDFIL